MNKILLTLLTLAMVGCATPNVITETDKWIKVKTDDHEVWIDQRRLSLIPPGYRHYSEIQTQNPR
jgi:hypothetical protein